MSIRGDFVQIGLVFVARADDLDLDAALCAAASIIGNLEGNRDCGRLAGLHLEVSDVVDVESIRAWLNRAPAYLRECIPRYGELVIIGVIRIGG